MLKQMGAQRRWLAGFAVVAALGAAAPMQASASSRPAACKKAVMKYHHDFRAHASKQTILADRAAVKRACHPTTS